MSAGELDQLVQHVAEESERRGRFVDALRLLDLCDVRKKRTGEKGYCIRKRRRWGKKRGRREDSIKEGKKKVVDGGRRKMKKK